MTRLIIEQIAVLNDNYVYLLHDEDGDATAVVDPAVAAPVSDALARRGWRLDLILNTHHHGDHTGANLELKAATGARVIGARNDQARIPGLDQGVGEGDSFLIGHTAVMVLETPGHTSGHICFWLPQAKALFCGDTLFSLGCGRLFEGSPAQMWASLSRLRDLPDDTLIHCAHEYTAANGRFARLAERDNPALATRIAEIARLRQSDRPTVPVRMAEERATNPFLRADLPELARAVGMNPGADPVQVFAELRRRKDVF